ncbi:MAG: DUF971 domain-containing protein [Pseudomonadota bacterium]
MSIPTEIRYSRPDRVLRVTFDDGTIGDIPATVLRVESPSAEVQGHGPHQKVIVMGKENVQIAEIQPVGHYAVRLIFDDGHQSGIYTWPYLKLLASQTSVLS